MRILLVFIFKLFELLLSSNSNKKRSYNYQSLSKREKVLALEKRRQQKGYKKQWLYYRCKEEGLLNEYNKLFKPNVDKMINKDFSNDNRVKLPFGKYKGKPVDEIWKSDRAYLKYIINQGWLDDYRDVETYVEELLFRE